MKKSSLYLTIFIVTIILAYVDFFLRIFIPKTILYSLNDYFWFIAFLAIFNVIFINMKLFKKILFSLGFLALLFLDEFGQIYYTSSKYYQTRFDPNDLIAYILAFVTFYIMYYFIEKKYK